MQRSQQLDAVQYDHQQAAELIQSFPQFALRKKPQAPSQVASNYQIEKERWLMQQRCLQQNLNKARRWPNRLTPQLIAHNLSPLSAALERK